jgi:hypothetical protein
LTLGQYFLGLALGALALTPLAVGAASLRVRLLRGWTGAPARLAEVVLFLALTWAVALALGTVGVLERATFVLASAATGALVFAVARRAGRVGEPAAPPPAPGTRRPGLAVAGAASALVLAQWGVLVLDSLEHGMSGSDTLSYHGPVAARFLQDGSITPLEFVYSDPIIPFLPFGTELLHGIGMVLFERDVLSPFMNMAWLAVALLAAWCIGRPYGLGPASLLSVSIVLASPTLTTSQAGLAGNDIVAVALVLSSAALLLNARWRASAVLIAAVAAGLALGAKVTAIAPVAGLTVGVIAAVPRPERLRLGGAWLAIVVVAGGFWYVRNLVRVGNPFPAVGLELGPLSLPSPPLPRTFVVADYLTDGEIWSDFLLPGLNTAFGEAWWAVLALAALGMVASVVAGRSLVRVLGVAAIVSGAAYLVTPRGADGPEDFPFFFMFTLRYVTPGLALALAVLPLVPPARRVAREWWFYGGLGALLVVTLHDSGIPAGDVRRIVLALGFGALLAAPVLLAGVRLPSRPALAAGLAATAAVGLALGYAVQRQYLGDRYADDPLAFARDLQDERIAVVGFVRTYPLYGTDLSNRVEQVAELGPHGAFLRIRSCRRWRAALEAGRYRYVVTSPPLLPYTLEGLIFGPAFDPKRAPEAAWTRSDPAAVVIARREKITVFRLDGPPSPSSCER